MKLQTSLRTRILLLAVLVAVGTGVLSSLVAGRFMEEALEKELEKQSEMISQMLADRITTHVINNDIVSVREALLEVVTGTEGVEFAYVVNFDGRIMAHTFQDGFPVDFMEAESGNSCRMHTGQYMAGQKPIMIVNHPLVEGLNAHIHIGMDESRAFSRIEKTQNTIMLTTLGVILLGIMFGFVLSTRVVKPLAKLTVSLRAFGEGKSRDNIVYKGGGLEVAELTGSFNRMITDRERMDEKLRLSEVRFRNLFDQMSSGVAVYEGKDDGKDFIFKDFNSASERIDKMNRGDVIGKSVLEVFQGVKEFGLFEVFQRVWKTGKPEYFPVSLYKDERIAGWRDNYVYKLPSGEIVAVYDDVTSQKQAEEALRKSEEKFRMLFQGAAEGILIADVETRKFRYANPAICSMLGYSEEELLTIGVNDIHPKDSLKEVLSNFEAQARGEQTLAPDIPCLRKDGKVIYVDINIALIQINGKECNAGFFTDITERKLAEQALRETTDYLQNLINYANAPIIVWDPEFRITRFNYAFERLTQKSAEEVLGKSPDILIPEERREEAMALIRRTIEGEKWETVEIPIQRTDGEVRIVLWNSATIYAADGTTAVAIVAQGQDITDRKKAVEELRESQEHLAVTLRSIGDGVIVTDPDGVVTLFNTVAQQLTGFSEKEAVGQPLDKVFRIINENSRETVENPVGKVLRSGLVIGLANHTVLISKDGTERAISDSGAPIRNKDGSIIGVVLVFRDVTEKRRLEEFAVRAQRLETAGRIAGQVAHDFNNLLAPLMAYPLFIKEAVPEGHEAHDYLDKIERAADQMADINQQLLTLGRRGHYTVKPININDIIRQVLKQLPPTPDTLVMEIDFSDDLMLVKGGASQVFRVFANLVTNALDAMHEMGQLTIRTENYYLDEDTGEHSRIPKGEYVKIVISDTGGGIPNVILNKIFEPFFTTKTTDRKRGSGLGLSVVHAVVDDHNGYVDFRSEVGSGTTFYLYFPVTREAADTEPVDDYITGGSEQILVVDDDWTQRDVTTALLEKLGYRVNAVSSGEEAIAFVKDRPQDLLVLDMIMPDGIDGTETYRWILESNPVQKAIIVSGYAESERVREVVALGAGLFVRKPLTMRTLAKSVRKELDRVVST